MFLKILRNILENWACWYMLITPAHKSWGRASHIWGQPGLQIVDGLSYKQINKTLSA